MTTDLRPMRRRTFLQTMMAAPSIGHLAHIAGAPERAIRHSRQPHIAVVGAGAFGGWTALHLLRNGAHVTLLDTWGPGNSRASSGGVSRIIRHAYEQRRYVDLVARSLEIWSENEQRWNQQVLHRAGVLFMGPNTHPFGRDSVTHLEAAGIEFEIWDQAQIAERYPQLNPEGLEWGIWEPTAGYLMARKGCGLVTESVIQEGGTFRLARVEPGAIRGRELTEIRLSGGSTLQADQYVFACGPWMGELFPDVLGDKIRPTRQEVFFFGTSGGEDPYDEPSFPVWADFGERVWYGMPGNEFRGFKIADDTRGGAFDPTAGERRPSESGLRAARDYVEYRFPGLKGAPLLDARVCQYEESPDADFIVDRHPEAENLWLVGGGSGHGYKHGAALGELVADNVLGRKQPVEAFLLSRFH